MPSASLPSPIGLIRVTTVDGLVARVEIDASPGEDRSDSVAQEAVRQLAAYFAGERRTFDLPFAPTATVRAGELRTAMCGIAYGETLTYGGLANRAASHARAIGQACRTNRLPILVPCHRVTSASGPEYYSAGDGARTKAWLLAHERSHGSDGDVHG